MRIEDKNRYTMLGFEIAWLVILDRDHLLVLVKAPVNLPPGATVALKCDNQFGVGRCGSSIDKVAVFRPIACPAA